MSGKTANLLSTFEVYPMGRDELETLALSERFGPDACLSRIIHLAALHGCRCVVEEKSCNSQDFEWETKGFYGGLFRKPSQKVSRLHFFKKQYKKNEVVAASSAELQNNYIGYCSLRPFKRQRVVEAHIPPLREGTSMQKRTFPLCIQERQVHILQKKLVVREAFPFMQQDTHYDCCAHVALRCMNQYLAHKGLARKLSIKEIVNIASSVPLAKRAAPTEGLSIDEIVAVIKGMGMDPLVYEYRKGNASPFPPDRVIYHYAESELPVLIGIPAGDSGHAVVVTGHSFDPDEWWADAEQGYYSLNHSGGCYHCSTTWLSEFLVSDDNFGPYMTIPRDHLRSFAANAHLMVIVAIPKEVHFKGEEAEVYAHAAINDEYYQQATSLFASGCSSQKWAELFWQAYEREFLVLRTLLVKSKVLKNFYQKQAYPDEVKDLVSRTPLPDMVWMTEFSVPQLFCQHRKLLGRLIIDSTSTPTMFGEPSYLIVNLPGQVVVRNPNDKLHRFLWETDFPREHLIR